jgi:DNA processing protein
MFQATFQNECQDQFPFINPIDAVLELGAYEYLWTDPKTTYKNLADRFSSLPTPLPSSFVEENIARETGERVVLGLRKELGSQPFNVRLSGEWEFPERLLDATHPIRFLYFQGHWDLIDTPMVAVVGSRHPSEEGIRRTRTLVRKLVEDGFTIVSGLAEGIDTAAHQTALELGGQTIAVIGTPLGQFYPKTNQQLQERIASDFLVISQVPVCRYAAQDYRLNRLFFPERNKTMAALTQGTIIVEAGETSGTLVQAREALKQKRHLFILNNCFENPALTWPEKFASKGAIRVRRYEEIRQKLEFPSQINH